MSRLPWLSYNGLLEVVTGICDAQIAMGGSWTGCDSEMQGRVMAARKCGDKS